MIAACLSLTQMLFLVGIRDSGQHIRECVLAGIILINGATGLAKRNFETNISRGPILIRFIDAELCLAEHNSH